MSNPFAPRFTVARSVQPLAWGIALVVGAQVLDQVSARLFVTAIENGEGTGFADALTWISILATVVGLASLVVGVVYLAGNVDYLAAREAERHRDEGRGD